MNPNKAEQKSEPLDEIFKALRQAEPSPGMQRRIVEKLAESTTAPAQVRRRWLTWPSVTFAAVASMVLLGWVVTEHRYPPIIPAAVSLAPPADAAPVAAVPGRNLPLIRSAATHARLIPEPARISISVATTPERNEPAPALPLTEQERLLLRLAHQTRALDASVPDPQLVAQQRVHDLAALDTFFERVVFAALTPSTPSQPAADQSTPGVPNLSTDPTPTANPNPAPGDDSWQPARN